MSSRCINSPTAQKLCGAILVPYRIVMAPQNDRMMPGPLAAMMPPQPTPDFLGTPKWLRLPGSAAGTGTATGVGASIAAAAGAAAGTGATSVEPVTGAEKISTFAPDVTHEDPHKLMVDRLTALEATMAQLLPLVPSDARHRS